MRAALPFLLLVACGDGMNAPHQVLPLSEDPNLTLHVSNQSFAISPVDVRITIDGQLAATGDFEVEGQHSWTTFRFRLAPGPHTLVATTAAGDARLEEVIDVSAARFAALDYWYYPASHYAPTPRHFSLFVSADPILFE